MNRWPSIFFLCAFLSGGVAGAVTCTTQSQMTDAQRTAYVQAVRSLAAEIQSGNISAVKANTIASVAAQFDPIAATIQSISPNLQGAVFAIQNIYSLNASDLKATADTQFFCSVPGSQMLTTVSLSQLPPGNYALALIHATGGKQPQQMAMILAKDPPGSADWKLAGFFVRPLAYTGHDGVWYWTQAREYAKKHQEWNAYFYYQTAAYLLAPVDFISSPNLEKLQKEMDSVRPDGLPGNEPMTVVANGQTYEITSLHTDGSLGQLDLVVNYKTADASDPVATRSRNIDVMKALLRQHPELREGFHGLWVYANAENQRPFGIEQPMNQIQ
ncbi:MAG TPA: hypothetical protein VHT24_15565 [Pseudacidobacterium sp.]|jgi:hypothetical protein|nr:hypothetical protein [Pseudacidobacterium sp.]